MPADTVELDVDEPAAAIPRTLGDYELIESIGQGGMAEVFLARRRGVAGFEKLVVVKCIHPHLTSSTYFVDMFLDEARLAARINDQNVVQIYELGEAHGRYFMAMEYLHGESMATVMQTVAQPGATRMSPHLVARIVADVAAGLHAAHELSDAAGHPLEVVHRDVSHDNIVVLYSGDVKVVDFGVARARNSIGKTSADTLKGKAAFMSPEQTRGEAIDRRSDVFALGVVMWEALVRRRLFAADSEPATIKRVIDGIVPPPSEIDDVVPRQLDEIALRALAKDPKERFQTAAEMRVALEAFIHRSGAQAGALEVAAFMKATFPERMAVRARVLDLAREQTGNLAVPDLAQLHRPVTGPQATPLPLKMAHSSRRRSLLLVVLGASVAFNAVYWFGGLGRSETRIVEVAAPPAAPVAVADAGPPLPKLVEAELDRAETAIHDGRIASPPGDNALELVLSAEKLDASNPRAKVVRSHAVEQLLASAGELWDHGKRDSARSMYGDVLLFDPHNKLALAREKVAAKPAKPTESRSVDDGKVAWLVAQIDLAIIERRFVAPPGHNALDYLVDLRKVDPSNDAARKLGLEVSKALVTEASAKPDDAKQLLAAAEQARGSAAPADNGKTPEDKQRDQALVTEWVTKGNGLLAAGRFGEARMAYEHAIAADGQAHAALAGLAEVSYDEGDYTRAVVLAKRAVAVAPRSVNDRMTLAKAYYKLSRYADAIEQWQKVVAVDPTNAAAKKNIEMAKDKAAGR